MLSQSFWRAKLVNSNNSLACLTVSRKSLLRIKLMKEWLFQFLGSLVIEEATDAKISSEKASVNPPFRVKNFRET